MISKPQLWRITLDTNPEDCNLKCIMCEEHSPYSDFIPKLYEQTGVKRRRMKFETLEAIFEQAEKLGIKEIIPSTMGEPLLYKDFERLFQLAASKNIKINLTTNGTFPKKSVLEWAKIIVPHTSDVKISWNGASAETAEKIMLGLDFQQSLNKLQSFIAYRDQYFQETGYYCRVTLQLTFMQNNIHEIPNIIKLAAQLNVDRVKGHQLWAHFEAIENLALQNQVSSAERWNQTVQAANLACETHLKPNGEKIILENFFPIQADSIQQEVPEHYECPFLNRELWISATGKISPCCAPDELRQSLGDFGNIEEQSLEAVLNSPHYQDLVKNYKTKTICKTCLMRKPK